MGTDIRSHHHLHRPQFTEIEIITLSFVFFTYFQTFFRISQHFYIFYWHVSRTRFHYGSLGSGQRTRCPAIFIVNSSGALAQTTLLRQSSINIWQTKPFASFTALFGYFTLVNWGNWPLTGMPVREFPLPRYAPLSGRVSEREKEKHQLTRSQSLLQVMYWLRESWVI